MRHTFYTRFNQVVNFLAKVALTGASVAIFSAMFIFFVGGN